MLPLVSTFCEWSLFVLQRYCKRKNGNICRFPFQRYCYVNNIYIIGGFSLTKTQNRWDFCCFRCVPCSSAGADAVANGSSAEAAAVVV